VTSTEPAINDPFELVVGQERAVEQLRSAAADPVHAYVFIGPRGSGKRRAAAAFAGELIGDNEDRERSRRLARSEDHPDLVVIEPEGNTLRAEEAEQVIVAASRAPVEAGAKVIVIDRFHDATAEAAARLLKPIEEPSASIRFVLLAEEIPPEHITIASRSTRIDFPAVTTAAITQALVGRGVPPEIAQGAADGSGGDVGRAELLVDDPAFAERRELWWGLVEQLDGSGHAVSAIVQSLREAVDGSQEPLDARHLVEAEAMTAQEELTGTRGSGRRAMDVRHKREARLHRTDEWRMGLATLAQRYREQVVAGGAGVDELAELTSASEVLSRNPSEELWLTALLLRLSPRR